MPLPNVEHLKHHICHAEAVVQLPPAASMYVHPLPPSLFFVEALEVHNKSNTDF